MLFGGTLNEADVEKPEVIDFEMSNENDASKLAKMAALTSALTEVLTLWVTETLVLDVQLPEIVYDLPL